MIHEVKKILRFRKSPDSGEDCLCSLCREPIYVTAVRCFGHEDGQSFELRFHFDCFEEFQRFKICDFEWGDEE